MAVIDRFTVPILYRKNSDIYIYGLHTYQPRSRNRGTGVCISAIFSGTQHISTICLVFSKPGQFHFFDT